MKVRKTIGEGAFGSAGGGVGRKRIKTIRAKSARRMRLMGDAMGAL